MCAAIDMDFLKFGEYLPNDLDPCRTVVFHFILNEVHLVFGGNDLNDELWNRGNPFFSFFQDQWRPQLL